MSPTVAWRCRINENNDLGVEKVGRQTHPLRHMPLRKHSPDPAAVRFFRYFSRIMWAGLSAGLGTMRPGSVLSGPIFSRPHDCAVLLNSL